MDGRMDGWTDGWMCSTMRKHFNPSSKVSTSSLNLLLFLDCVYHQCSRTCVRAHRWHSVRVEGRGQPFGFSIHPSMGSRDQTQVGRLAWQVASLAEPYHQPWICFLSLDMDWMLLFYPHPKKVHILMLQSETQWYLNGGFGETKVKIWGYGLGDGINVIRREQPAPLHSSSSFPSPPPLSPLLPSP